MCLVPSRRSFPLNRLGGLEVAPTTRKSHSFGERLGPLSPAGSLHVSEEGGRGGSASWGEGPSIPLQFSSFNTWLTRRGFNVFYDSLVVLRRWNKCWAGLAVMLMCSAAAAMLL